jgi:alpha-L-fucosidase
MNRRQWLQMAAALPLVSRVRAAEHKLARPSPEQVAWQDMELSMFVHFGPATWQDSEYDTLGTPLDRINPSKLDTEQWAEVAQSLGARQVIFVAKHTGGFCWWQTATSDYSVRKTPWREGKGDVMRDLAESCRKRNLKLGVYLSPQDKSLGAGLGGKCADPAKQPAYNAIYRQQLTELLSRYGDISEVWFDGSSVTDSGDILQRYAPHAIIFQSPYASIRWVGNEDGVAPDPNWNAVPRDVARSGVATAKDGTPDGDAWLPCEVDARIHDTWFWNTQADQHLKSLERLMSMYYRSVGHGGLLLLNNTPDTSGLIPDLHAKRTAEFGAEIRRRFTSPIAEMHGSGGTMELAVRGAAKSTKIDHVMLMEDTTKGQRVRVYSVFGRVGNDWRELSRGTSIGHKKIDSFRPVEVSAAILRMPDAEGSPEIRRFAVFATGQRDQGTPLVILSDRVIYNWKPASFDSGRNTWDIDLLPFVKDAGEYEVSFIVTGGGIVVRSLTLMADGAAHDEYVTRERNRAYRLRIPGLGSSLDLRAVVSSDEGDPPYGQITITRTE